MAIAVILVGCGFLQFVFLSILIVGARGEDREREDREQEEYLRQWSERKRQKRELRRSGRR